MKTLKFVTGNLLTSRLGIQVIGHQANCQNVFGSGIARSIKTCFPEAWDADCKAALRKVKVNTLGKFSKADVATNSAGINRVYNLYGQNLGTGDAGASPRKTNYEALYSALEGMRKDLILTGDGKMMFDFDRTPVVGFPYKMGSALGGGSWDVVQRLIEVAFDGYSSDVIIVALP